MKGRVGLDLVRGCEGSLPCCPDQHWWLLSTVTKSSSAWQEEGPGQQWTWENKAFLCDYRKGACLESSWEMEMRCRRAELNSKYLGGKRSLAKWEHICFSHSLAQWPHWSGGVLGWQAPARRRWWVNIQEFSNRFGYFRLAMIRVMTAGNWPLIHSWLLFFFSCSSGWAAYHPSNPKMPSISLQTHDLLLSVISLF